MTNAQPSFRVLVADDEPAIIDAYQSLLTTAPAHAQAGGALDALESELFNDSPATVANDNPVERDFQLHSFGQGQEAVNAVRQATLDGNPYSVAFLDVRMPPGINGVETAKQIRAIDPNINIVIVTGYSDIHPRQIASQVPPLDRLFYVAKPFKGPEIEQFASALSYKWQSEIELDQSFAQINQQYDELKKTHAAATSTIKRINEVSSAKSRFIAELTEQFREPLKTVFAYVEMAVGAGTEPTHGEKATESVLSMINSLHQIQDLIRADGGKLIVQNQQISLHEIVQTISGELAGRFSAGNIAFSQSYEPDRLRANVDPDPFAQILTNLFSNSLRRVQDGGEITFAASDVSENLMLTISDTGSYPFAREIEGPVTIFDLIPADNDKQGTFEIGIALACALVEALGGTFSVRSQPGGGTTFFVGLESGS